MRRPLPINLPNYTPFNIRIHLSFIFMMMNPATSPCTTSPATSPTPLNIRAINTPRTPRPTTRPTPARRILHLAPLGFNTPAPGGAACPGGRGRAVGVSAFGFTVVAAAAGGG
jgi:hypothetical protein